MVAQPDSPHQVLDRVKMRVLCEYYGWARLVAGDAGDQLPLYAHHMTDEERAEARRLLEEIRRHIDEGLFPSEAQIVSWSERLGNLH